jgi:hypothetical protein
MPHVNLEAVIFPISWCIGTGEVGPGFFFQFCDVAEVAIIHKMIYPDLATE